MEVSAKANFIKMSPKKIRLVVDLVRGENTEKALSLLKFSQKLAGKPVTKLINSGIANAVNNFKLDKDNLYIKEIRVDEGPVMKRWMPKAFGRATHIRKRSAHIILVLGEIKDSGEVTPKSKKSAKPLKSGIRPKEDEGVKIKQDEKKVEKDDLKIEKVNIEKGKKIVDVTREGRHGHARIEGGGHKGFTSKVFRRKSG